MSLTAILSARVPPQGEEGHTLLRALLPFGGGTFIEHQARQVIDAGARRILIHADVVPPALARVADRLGARDDLSVEIVRELPLFAACLDRDDRVLCLGDGMLVPQDALAALAAGAAPRLLVTPRVAATEWLERIDAQDVWAGAVLLPGGLVLDTLDLLGEWDLMSTLVRVAVQHGAGRLVISPEHAMDGQLTQITSPSSAGLALQTLSIDQRMPATGRPGLAHRLTQSVGKAIAGVVIRRQIDPRRLVAPSLALAGSAVLAAALGWPAVAMLAMLAGYAVFGIAREAGAILLHPPRHRWPTRTLTAAALLSIALAAVRAGWGEAFAPVAVLLVLGLLLLVAIEVERGAAGHGADSRLPGWCRLDVPTSLALMLLGTMTGGVSIATGFVGLFALAEIALRKDRIAAVEPNNRV